jgi:hypothetical protein
VSRSIEIVSTDAANHNEKIDRRLKSIEEHLSMLVSAIAIHPTLRGNAMRDTNTAENTRTVMFKVPATVLALIWQKHRPNSPFPVLMEYLHKLFKALAKDYELDVRRELGTVFAIPDCPCFQKELDQGDNA